MQDNETNIHDFDFELICSYFASLKRQGPGSDDQTMKALSFIENLDKSSYIADLGCGSGSQTIVLAQNTKAKITAIDLFPTFINLLNDNVSKLNLSSKVKGIVASMDNLPFKEEEFELIWSEGAIYNIGFERGLKEWRKYLKMGGYIAVSESSWFTDERPKEINNFWMNAYPEIDTLPHQVTKLYNAGYLPVATFILPNNCWTEHYLAPKNKAQEIFLKKYAGNKNAEEFLESERYEEELYSKYSDYYGYVFFIAKKIEL